MSILVIGTGIVGSAAIWDLKRRGYEVVAADADSEAVSETAARFDVDSAVIDVDDARSVQDLFAPHALVVSAVPYRYGVAVARAAIATNTHAIDFGGNPDIVASQKTLHGDAVDAGVMIVPDCGLAPGLANVMASMLIEAHGPEPIDRVQIRVGALPQVPIGSLGYQLAFSPDGLINEYAEPCEVIEAGRHTTVEPLSRFETVDWDPWGPLEAFSTAGGTSTMCSVYAGRIEELEYKTLRYPGHGRVFRAFFELGLFDEETKADGRSRRDILLAALREHLPRGAPDLVLVRVWVEAGDQRHGLQIEDREQGGFTALARTTAFPATALADLIVRGAVAEPGVGTMHEVAVGASLLAELEPVGITAEAV
ncbi:MAG: saccharopine dehydrogenase C-terminal domain-containing protein [Acidimicrobiia bacterium]